MKKEKAKSRNLTRDEINVLGAIVAMAYIMLYATKGTKQNAALVEGIEKGELFGEVIKAAEGEGSE